MGSRYTAGFLEMLKKFGVKRVAVLHADDAFSLGTAKGTNEWARRFGLSVVYSQGFNKGHRDFAPMIISARKARAEALILCAYLDEAVQVRHALKTAAWSPRAYYASVGPALQVFASRLGKDADGTCSSSQWERLGRLPGALAFYESYKTAYGVEPSYHAANAYAAGQILARAVQKAGSLDRQKIRHYLATMNTITVIGRYGVDKAGRQIKHFPLVIQWQKGRKEIVWPMDLRTAKAVLHP